MLLCAQVLQSVFDSQQITKHVDVSRLVKGKFQDNLEMLQWMKHYFDTHYGGQPYDAKARREEAKAMYKKGHKHAGTGIKRPAAAAAAAAADDSESSSAAAAPVAKPAAAAKPASKPASAAAPKPAARAAVAAKPAARAPAGKVAKKGDDDAAELTAQLSKLTVTIEGLEKERNCTTRQPKAKPQAKRSASKGRKTDQSRLRVCAHFRCFVRASRCAPAVYFGKLREIEILCQESEDAAVAAAAADANPEVDAFKKSVLAILYATDENAEFQTPEDAAAANAGAEEATTDGGDEGLLGSDELPEQ